MRQPGLDKALGALDAGDSLVVWRLDRSLPHLSETIWLIGDKDRIIPGSVAHLLVEHGQLNAHGLARLQQRLEDGGQTGRFY